MVHNNQEGKKAKFTNVDVKKLKGMILRYCRTYFEFNVFSVFRSVVDSRDKDRSFGRRPE